MRAESLMTVDALERALEALGVDRLGSRLPGRRVIHAHATCDR